MESGYEESAANGITHSPERRTKRPKRAYQNDEAENAPGKRLSRAPLLIQENLFRSQAPSSRCIAAVSAAVYFLAAKDAENTK